MGRFEYACSSALRALPRPSSLLSRPKSSTFEASKCEAKAANSLEASAFFASSSLWRPDRGNAAARSETSSDRNLQFTNSSSLKLGVRSILPQPRLAPHPGQGPTAPPDVVVRQAEQPQLAALDQLQEGGTSERPLRLRQRGRLQQRLRLRQRWRRKRPMHFLPGRCSEARWKWRRRRQRRPWDCLHSAFWRGGRRTDAHCSKGRRRWRDRALLGSNRRQHRRARHRHGGEPPGH
mmetsp:Transcript_55744/g.180984  ORF Transcript_55744/g.180984 Transcript_55744/m.180984 type:complete len:235 (-) Transcript_55744:669-1373(-)